MTIYWPNYTFSYYKYNLITINKQHMNLKHVIGYSSIVLTIGFTSARSYPIQEVKVNNCIIEQEVCETILPQIHQADYDTYKDMPIYRRIYTMLRWSTYIGQWDIGKWSHKWVDIATKPKTPVYAIHKGKVITAWREDSWGNVIVIEHAYNGSYIYSVYAHLWTIFVKKWDNVDEQYTIAEVWDSGNTSWPHLHFQIDINQQWVHPFHFYNCPGTLTDIVNAWLCRNQLLENTIDPIAFIEQRIQESQDIIEPNSDLIFNNFAGGHSKRNAMQFINIRQKEVNKNISPITIKFDTEKLRVFPRELSFVWSQRTVYFKWLENGLTTIDLRQDNRIIKRIPIIINDEESFHVNNKTITDLFERIPLQ